MKMGTQCEEIGQPPLEVTVEPDTWRNRFGHLCGSYGKGICRCGREVGLNAKGELSRHDKPEE